MFSLIIQSGLMRKQKAKIFFSIDERVWPLAAFFFVSGVVLSLWFFPAGALFFCLLMGHLVFFRDPERQVDLQSEGVAVSPADGKIVEISTVNETKYLHGKAVKIGIFLSIFNVHVNRMPDDGKVEYLDYVPGRFIWATSPSSSQHNESNWIGCRKGERRFLVRQIAGNIARRIRCDASLSQEFQKGEKIGIICYGSRVEIYAPADLFTPSIRLGDKVRAGETPIGRWTV